jgi:hypothetical protein
MRDARVFVIFMCATGLIGLQFSTAASSEAIALPISFGPSSAAHVLTIQKHLLLFQRNPQKLDALWTEVADAYEDLCNSFTAASNMQSVPHGLTEQLVVAWLKRNAKKSNAQQFIADVLHDGLPVLGRKEESKVIGARAARKLIKAWKKIRKEFTTISEYRDAMLMLQFEYLPLVMQTANAQTMAAAFDIAKKGENPNVILASSASDQQPKDQLEMLRYVGYYLCRETAPEATVLSGPTSLTGWMYGGKEEDTLLALHYPVFEEQLGELTREKEGTDPNELLDVQIALYGQFLKRFRSRYSRFLESNTREVRVGGSGRVSAEVSRDLSKIQRVATIAIDHRRQQKDVFEENGQLKKAFSNFWKELAKDRGHLPAFKDEAIAKHYQHIHNTLRTRDADRKTADNIACVLRANAKTYSLSNLPEPDDAPVRLAKNDIFQVAFGYRGEGDILYAHPAHYASYHPGTMDEKVKEGLESLHLGQQHWAQQHIKQKQHEL